MNPQQEARLLDVVLIALAFCSAVALVLFVIGCAPLPERGTSPPLGHKDPSWREVRRLEQALGAGGEQ